MMIRWFSTFFCLLALCACSNSEENVQNRAQKVRQWQESKGKLKVLSTVGMIDDLVKRVGGSHTTTLTLIEGELDPHSYQLVKGDDEKFIAADIIFSNGLGLEHGPSLQKHLRNNPKVIALGNLIQSQQPTRILHYNEQVDPHIWTDMSLWAQTVPFMVQALSARDPAHAEDYKTNGKALMQSLLESHNEIIRTIHQIPQEKRYLVTSHDAFNYFVKAYLATDDELANNDWQKRFAAPEGLAPESQLSTADIQNIIEYAIKYHIRVIFPESNVSKDSIKKIVNAGKEKGLQLRIADDPLYGDAMGGPQSDGNTYENMMHHNAKMLIKWWNTNDDR